MAKKKRKPTAKQKQTFEHVKKGMQLRDAMLAGGYTPQTATHPKQNFIDAKGTQTLIEKYKDLLLKAGIDLPVLVEIQAEGLFDQNAAIRLMYLKETKKDFGLASEEKPTVAIQNNTFQLSDEQLQRITE